MRFFPSNLVRILFAATSETPALCLRWPLNIPIYEERQVEDEAPFILFSFLSYGNEEEIRGNLKTKRHTFVTRIFDRLIYRKFIDGHFFCPEQREVRDFQQDEARPAIDATKQTWQTGGLTSSFREPRPR